MTQPNTSQKTVEVADTNLEPRDIPLEDPVPTPNDPGGAHAKGYSADADPNTNPNTKGPIPLAAPPEGAQICQPEKEDKVLPTGRREPRDYTPNDRLMGSDR